MHTRRQRYIKIEKKNPIKNVAFNTRDRIMLRATKNISFTICHYSISIKYQYKKYSYRNVVNWLPTHSEPGYSLSTPNIFLAHSKEWTTGNLSEYARNSHLRVG